MKTRVRGIYATALTRALATADGETGVVQASGPIRDRFSDKVAVDGGGRADVRVETTDDRQGVTMTGAPDAVSRATEVCRSAGVDALAWDAAAPLDGVFDAEVTGTERGTAICDLGVATGQLPFDRVDDHVETGDRLRVQVAAPAPP